MEHGTALACGHNSMITVSNSGINADGIHATASAPFTMATQGKKMQLPLG
jgi:hypothetical protein